MIEAPQERAVGFAWWLEPIVAGKWGGASRLTVMVALGLPAAWLLSMIMLPLMALSSSKIVSNLELAFLVMAGCIGFGSVPAAVGLFIWDRVRGAKARAAAVEHAATASRNSAAAARTQADREFSAARVALAAIYASHHAALVAEASRILAAGKYGRRDVAAAAAEFSAFQDTVAEPELVSQGHSATTIRGAFAADRSKLIGAILAGV